MELLKQWGLFAPGLLYIWFGLAGILAFGRRRKTSRAYNLLADAAVTLAAISFSYMMGSNISALPDKVSD